MRRSHRTNVVSATAETTNAATIGALDQPSLGASMIAHTSATSPTIESSAPVQSIGCVFGLRESGTKNRIAISAPDDDRHVHDEHRAPPEVVEQESSGDGPERDRDTGDARPEPDRDRALTRVREHVRQDRQRRRHDERRADAHHGACTDELADAVRERGRGGRGAEDDEADRQRAPPPEPVTERTGGEEQPGEDERVARRPPTADR